MDPLRKVSTERFGRVLQYVSDQEDTILDAHLNLGIPLEDLIAGAARRALTVRASDGNTQLNLLFKDTREARS